MLIKNSNKKVLIVGCGRFGSNLASSLCNANYDVSVIDKDESAFNRLSETFTGFEIVGDASDLDTLKSCEISNCDMVLVATDNDNTNCMIAQIANTIYNIGNVYIRLNDPDKEKLLLGSSIKAIYPSRLSLKEFENISNIHFEKALRV
ncbi:MAG: TrkA family potassium uptake protein [Longicatena sp.]